MIDKDLFKKIQRIQFNASHLSDAIFAGAYRSAFRGQGMEFEEVREYQPGDDVRNIDWNVTARMNRPYMKSFREEREMTVMLVVDMSASTRYGSKSQLKSDLIAEISALLAFSAVTNNDRIGLILFSDRVQKYIKPKRGLRHILRIVRELLSPVEFGPKTDIAGALSFAGKMMPHSSICFLISDFIAPDFSKEARIISNKHDLIAINIVDPTERVFPSMSLVTYRDPETQATALVDTGSSEVLASLQKGYEQHLEAQKKLIRQMGASWLVIETNRPYLTYLRHFLSDKGRTRR